MRRWSRVDGVALILFVAALAAAESPYLNLSFAFKGDEEFHVLRAMQYEAALVQGWTAGRALLAWTAFATASVALASALLRWRWRLVAPALVLVAGWIALGFQIESATGVPLAYWLKRYPPMHLVVEVAFANRLAGTDDLEWSYRLGALLPTAAFALWPFVALRRRGLGTFEALGASVALASIPVVFYFAGVLYIEPLLLAIEGAILAWLVAKDRLEERDLFGIAMLAGSLGLVKETALPFIAAVGIWLAFATVVRGAGPWLRRAAIAARLGGLLVLPSVPYMLVRWASGERPYSPTWSNLWAPELLTQYLEAVREQLTPAFVVAAVGGFVLMILRRRHLAALGVSLLALVGNFVLFSCDALGTIGYARFVLTFVPSLSVGFVGLLDVQREIARSATLGPRIRSWLIIGLVSAAGLANVPWRLEERESWGCPGKKDGEYFYPYDVVFAEVARDAMLGGRFLLAGLDYPYHPISFYLRRHRLGDRYVGMIEGRLTPAQAIAVARDNRIPLLVYHHRGEAGRPVAAAGSRHRSRFTLGRRTLDLYEVR